MSDLNFIGVTEENRSEFHRLMQQYAKELDEHQNRTTDSEMLRKWTDRIIEKQSERSKYISLCYSDGTAAGFFFGRIDLPEDKGFTKEGWGCIVEFYVIPECRGKGCGREMFLHLQAIQKRRRKENVSHRRPRHGKTVLGSYGLHRNRQNKL